ncbi:hypothetical protein [uncultured Nocardioides sp.]|uniref:hypothetical protein n=1 Tax=uncultured Nocardioides sp. TaxID=198441 RepID=UPI00261BB7D1|nr:hypothetical protein [uncultured Nocardioides sp.]HRD59396.1 hypothetical protein [Nocardioides sp.]
MTRTWVLPSADQRAAYARLTLSLPTSTLPGLTALEASAAMAYIATLPMTRDRSVTEEWAALPQSTRSEWVGRTREMFEAAL